MSGPTQRVLAVLELLQARGRISGADLAREIDVDPRTVRRYIARLEGLGIPIVANRGRDGSYALVPGFKLPPLLFDDDEALALALGLRAVRAMGLAATAPAVASALAKLERVMPGGLRRRVGALDETVALELAHPVVAVDHALLSALSVAAQQRRRVRLDYRSPQGDTTTRLFDPYGLLWRTGRWYALGHCHLRRAVRSFRLDRVLAVVPVDASFARPEQFDAREHMNAAIARLPRTHPVDVLLHTDLDTARRELFASLGVLEPVPGGVRLQAQVDSLDWFAGELARLPFEVTIATPPALRDAVTGVAERCRRMATRA
ncbi:helix-turn-helix transcriptional regulator [Chiayiivirga flava]|uniref:Putative DNA-binding transcriptional regulator YafY n=1 Tax=Chiayiivirga flava TaxID=659595 RepID=A0A7W8D479_9GAMM|nr:YafY family protein [Chiayiivirga flava]MBB5207604.1 putative DNA-binding transcriptional regulator YafY [Chiayiivirga flava]